MNILDLTPEYIKTAMMSQRIVLFPNGYGLSIIGGHYAYGDGVHTFEIAVIKHNFKTDKDVDYFGLDFSNYSKDDLMFKLVYPPEICNNNVLGYVKESEFNTIVEKVKRL